MHQDGMLLTVSGMYGNFLRLQPPLTISTEQLDALVSSLKRALEHTRANQ